jgi:hypothetical protein
MKLIIGSFVTLSISLVGGVLPANAQGEPSTPPADIPTQQLLTSRQVLEACVQNRADTLPIPFSDLSPEHWAFKAVMTVHYCGPFRQATPPSLIERLTNPQAPQPTQS